MRECSRHRRSTRDARRTGDRVRAARCTDCCGASCVRVDVGCTLDGRCGIDRHSIGCTVVTKRGVTVNLKVAFSLRVARCNVHRELRATDRESGARNVNAILGIDIAAKLNLTAGLRKGACDRRCSTDVGCAVDVHDRSICRYNIKVAIQRQHSVRRVTAVERQCLRTKIHISVSGKCVGRTGRRCP